MNNAIKNTKQKEVINMLNSINKSTQIKEGLRKSFEDVNSKIANRPCYGYTQVDDGKLIIHPVESEVVKFIFKCYNKGNSLGKIAKALEDKNIQSPTGRAKWNKEALNKLISNEKYTGRVMLQKTHTLCGIQLENDGELQKILITNHHKPIISIEEFEKVQSLKMKRAKPTKNEMSMKMTY